MVGTDVLSSERVLCVMQTKTQSAVEATLNIGSGFILAIIVWQGLAALYDIPMPLSRNLQITSIFTVVSITRSYIWRRVFTTKLNNWFKGDK